MTSRHPFFDPESSFRELWDSIPPASRVRDYLRWIEDQRSSPGPDVSLRVSRTPSPRDRYREAAGATGERLLLSLADPVQIVETARFAVELEPPETAPVLRITLTIPKRGGRPSAPTPCTLLMLRPEALEPMLLDFPDLSPEKDHDMRPTFRGMFDRGVVRLSRVALLVAGLPAVEGTLGPDGIVAFRIPLESKESFAEIRRNHLIAVIEPAAVTKEGSG
jgi:hypothetical protein